MEMVLSHVGGSLGLYSLLDMGCVEMKLTIERKVLLPMLAALAKIAGSKTAPILDDILFEVGEGQVWMTAGDGEKAMQRYTRDVKVSSVGLGGVTIPAKKLYEFVNKMSDGTITMTKVAEGTEIKNKKSKVTMQGQDPAMYPEFQQTSVKSVKMLGADFKDMVERTKFAVSPEGKGSKVIEGVRFNAKGSSLSAVGCDRHRLSYVAAELKTAHTGAQSVVSGDVFKDLLRMIDDKEMVDLTFEENYFFVDTDSFSFNSRVLDGTYPDVFKMLPQTFTTHFDIKVDDLKGAVERALIIALDDKTNIVRMTIDEGITITSESQNDKAVETLEAKVIGQPLKVSFNGKYMVQAMEAMSADTVRLCFNGVMQPIIMRTDGKTDLQMILPYRTH